MPRPAMAWRISSPSLDWQPDLTDGAEVTHLSLSGIGTQV